MNTVISAALLLTLVPATARAQVNAGQQKPEESMPFTMTQVATFNLPWRIAFLPDGLTFFDALPVRQRRQSRSEVVAQRLHRHASSSDVLRHRQ